MKPTRLIALAAALAASPALAADLSAPGTGYVAPPAATPFQWSGMYFGVQGGYDWNHATNTSNPDEGIAADVNGGIAGVYGGYNWQFGQAVFGVDASINYDWAQGGVNSLGVPTGNTAEVDWKAFLRARLGWAIAERLLIYGTAGGSVADLKPIFAGGVVQGDPSAWGWTIGAGAEWAFADHWTARVDYAYANYGTFNYPSAITATMNSHTLTFGVALKY